MRNKRFAKLAGALGVTGAFTLGSIATTIVLALSIGGTSYTGVAASEWIAVGSRLLAYAIVFGLLVDAIRFIARVLWPKTSAWAPSLTDLVNLELS